MQYNTDYLNWLNKYNIPDCTINKDLSIDVNCNVYLNYEHLTEIPVKFNKIKGNFNCGRNQLTSTNFLPKEVYGFFFCYNTNFKNLDNFPKIVTGNLSFENAEYLENIIGLWSCDFRGNEIHCDGKWKEEIECYLISINRLKEVEIYAH
jgi:hypothetical protein